MHLHALQEQGTYVAAVDSMKMSEQEQRDINTIIQGNRNDAHAGIGKNEILYHSHDRHQQHCHDIPSHPAPPPLHRLTSAHGACLSHAHEEFFLTTPPQGVCTLPPHHCFSTPHPLYISPQLDKVPPCSITPTPNYHYPSKRCDEIPLPSKIY